MASARAPVIAARKNLSKSKWLRSMERAQKHRTRQSIQQYDYKRDDLVDVWFEPSNKDSKGWRGPGKILSVNTSVTVLTLTGLPLKIRDILKLSGFMIVLNFTAAKAIDTGMA